MSGTRASGAPHTDGYMYILGDGYRKTKTGNRNVNTGQIKGEAQDPSLAKVNAFSINTFSWDTRHNSGSTYEEGGPISTEDDKVNISKGFGKLESVTVSPFKITKDVDTATPLLFHASVFRSVYPSAHVVFRKAAGNSFYRYFRFRFTDLVVESWNVDITSDVPVETVTFGFTWCEIRYNPQSHSGVVSDARKPVFRQFCVGDPENTSPPSALSSQPNDEDNIATDSRMG
jgi:type VI protein secretion system component Hcp